MVWMTEGKKKKVCYRLEPLLSTLSAVLKQIKNKITRPNPDQSTCLKGIRRGEKKRPNWGITSETSGMTRPSKKLGIVGAISGTCLCKQDDTGSWNPEGGPYSEGLLRVSSVKILSQNLKGY